MPDEDKNFGGSLVLDFRKWWRQVKTIYNHMHNIWTRVRFWLQHWSTLVQTIVTLEDKSRSNWPATFYFVQKNVITQGHDNKPVKSAESCVDLDQ